MLRRHIRTTHSPLVNPYSNNHIILVCDNEHECDNAIIKYINEGFKRDQLCVLTLNRNKKAMARLSSKISNYDENVNKGNLIILDPKKLYISALDMNMKPFDDLKNQVIIRIKNRLDKRVRVVGDCVSMLFKNKHFDECLALEEWWQKKPFKGSYVCPYPKSILSKQPFNDHKEQLFNTHDKVITYH